MKLPPQFLALWFPMAIYCCLVLCSIAALNGALFVSLFIGGLVAFGARAAYVASELSLKLRLIRYQLLLYFTYCLSKRFFYVMECRVFV